MVNTNECMPDDEPNPTNRGTVPMTFRIDKPWAVKLKDLSARTQISQKRLVQLGLSLAVKHYKNVPDRRLVLRVTVPRKP